MPGRTFRDKTCEFWDLWPVSPICDEIHHVVHVDGLWFGRLAVVLIACTKDHAIGWHLARSESAEGWVALMSRIAAPDVVVSDGGNGLEKARRIVWPTTRVQRCTFHAFEQVRRCTTRKPKLQAGVELYGIAKSLMHTHTLNEAAVWMAALQTWCDTWQELLEEKTIIDGRIQYRHQRLRQARGGLVKLAKAGALFTYLDEQLIVDGVIPSTNNRIEGGINAQLRHLLREHRGLKLDRRIKAVFWWCLMHTECPPTPKEILSQTPTDQTIAELYKALSDTRENDEVIQRWGTAIQWADLHTSSPFRSDWD